MKGGEGGGMIRRRSLCGSAGQMLNRAQTIVTNAPVWLIARRGLYAPEAIDSIWLPIQGQGVNGQCQRSMGSLR